VNVIRTEVPDVLVLEPSLHGDMRGFFLESYNARAFREAAGADWRFVQDNHSRSQRGVLRGLHYQVRHTQGKLVRVARGVIFDVAVDVRRSSPTFGRWVGAELTEENHRQIWVPPGFAHGFVVRSETADVLYKTTDYYAPEHERSILWNDPAIGIDWGLEGEPILSARDRAGVLLRDAEVLA
jgi:dTDP-4-dehydrorhamnose 3,5-epimerase